MPACFQAPANVFNATQFNSLFNYKGGKAPVAKNVSAAPSTTPPGANTTPGPALGPSKYMIPGLLPLPLTEQKLTRSEALFARHTTLNPFSLSISNSGDEFFLFMEMRAEMQWTSFSMDPRKWVTATRAYNLRLEGLCRAKNIKAVEKSPQALVSKLGYIEGKVCARILKQDYKCTSSGFLNRPALFIEITLL